MLTSTEMNKIVSQINASFEQDRKRLKALEERVALLEEPPKTPKAATKAPKED